MLTEYWAAGAAKRMSQIATIAGRVSDLVAIRQKMCTIAIRPCDRPSFFTSTTALSPLTLWSAARDFSGAAAGAGAGAAPLAAPFGFAAFSALYFSTYAGDGCDSAGGARGVGGAAGAAAAPPSFDIWRSIPEETWAYSAAKSPPSIFMSSLNVPDSVIAPSRKK